ncbi:hypothetical protein D0B54_03220 [Solimonas sp. K1W22B-7]|uniref:hypothetical protein n=1 Tax=Solimonas sp. K1W22B-7 TaxID=2303331 RepID=UPI000E32E7BB|nr:hypothetical protein [Solimonas sp. K1W22B-7]AXQ27740.1 hypothetical protein D0B54_03220 [Solimonas sp. K1W22B-7]
MNPEETPKTAGITPAFPSRGQLKASALAEALAVKKKWKTLIVEARTTWPKLHLEELATVGGNFHVLAGLVQLRHRYSREESDRQVKEFFARHYPVA